MSSRSLPFPAAKQLGQRGDQAGAVEGLRARAGVGVPGEIIQVDDERNQILIFSISSSSIWSPMLSPDGMRSSVSRSETIRHRGRHG